MATAPYARSGLALGLLASAGALAGAGLYLWREWRRRQPSDHPAAAFAGTGVHKDSPVQVRDAGPEHIRDEDGEDWDALDQASDESFPTSDPPTANDFRTPEPIDYSTEKASRPH